jgi:hypothetical protein
VGPREEYLVYSGGSAAACKSNTLSLKQTGSFSDARSYWTVNTNSKLQSSVRASGRGCSKANTYLAPSSSTDKRSTSVALTAGASTWQLRPVGGDCSVVNVINVNRQKKGWAAFLSSSGNCGTKSVTLASKDTGSGRQQWTLDQI